MQTMSLSQLKKTLGNFYDEKLPLALWGKPSTGKTSAFRQFAQAKAEELKLKFSEDDFGPEFFTFKTIIPSQFDPVDFIGMMRLDEKTGTTYFNPVASFPREGQGIFFIDEISNADHTIIAPLQRLMLEGRLENYKMPETFWRVCAGNEVKDLCQTNELSLAFYRRLAHIKVEPTVEEVVGYFLEQDRDVRVIAYLRRFSEDLFPKELNEKLLDTKANPFPYTWEMAAKMVKDMKDYVKIQELAGAWVGEYCATRFVAFCKSTDKVDINAIIANPKKILAELANDKEKPSLFFAIISILSSMWKKKDKVLVADKVVELLAELPAEFSVFFLTLLLKVPLRKKELLKLSSFQEVVAKVSFYIGDED
jgi:MoxR-like ATPase